MLRSLTIEGFRGLRRFALPELRRVNLLVGRNNGGKTAVLEAAGWLASGGSFETLELCTADRGEPRPTQGASLRPLFWGHPRPLAGVLAVSGQRGAEALTLSAEADGAGVLTLTRGGAHPSRVLLPLSPEGEPGALKPWERGTPPSQVTWNGVHGDSTGTLAAMWAELVGNPAEELVGQALRILEPRVRRVVFTPAQPPEVFLVLDGAAERVPLASMGEGTRRLLSLSINLAQAAGGLALFDELDTGLHHRALVDLWRLVLRAARPLDVQVLATTHSLDALRALAWLHAEEPALTEDFLLHTVHKEEERARTFTAAEVEVAMDSLVELRG